MRSLFICLTCLIIGTGCTKKKTQNISRTENLCSSAWQLWRLEEKQWQGAWVWVDITNAVMPCTYDNIFKYDINGLYKVTQGATACFASDSAIVNSSTWQFQQNESVIFIQPNQTQYIQTLTADTLRIQEKIPVGWDVKEYQSTYIHK